MTRRPLNPSAPSGGTAAARDAATQDAKPLPWAVRLPPESAAAAAGLRLWPGVSAADAPDGLWLRGEHASDPLDLALRKLPGAERFTVSADEAVVPVGRRVPTGRLPPGPWRPLAERFRPLPQPPALPGRAASRVPLRLERAGGGERPADVLVTALADWVAWAADAPRVRLRPLAFAASADGRAVVRGTPLPPLPGRRYVHEGGVAVPAGFALAPAVDAATVRALLGTAADDLLLLDEGGRWERVRAGDLVAATRAAARATAAAAGRRA